MVIAPAVAPRTISLLLGSTIFNDLEYMTSKVAPGMQQETTSRSSEGRGTLMDPECGAGRRVKGQRYRPTATGQTKEAETNALYGLLLAHPRLGNGRRVHVGAVGLELQRDAVVLVQIAPNFEPELEVGSSDRQALKIDCIDAHHQLLARFDRLGWFDGSVRRPADPHV